MFYILFTKYSFYRYDSVDESVAAKHWVDPALPRPGRLSFQLGRGGGGAGAGLQLAAAVAGDAGLYRCRADFQRSRTVITWVELAVVGEFSVGPSSYDKFHCSMILKF